MGLTPHEGQYGRGVYFGPTEADTRGYGGPEEEMLRVSKANLKKYGYSEFPEQGWAKSRIPPEVIEHKVGNKWVPLASNVQANIPAPRSVGTLSDEAFLEKVTGVKQTPQEMADYLDADPGSVKAMVQDLRDYARVNAMDDKGVDDLFVRFKNVTRAAKESYNELVGDLPDQIPSAMGGERRALKNLQGISLMFNKAKTRADKVIVIDKLMNLEHARGMMLPYGYGVSDMDRGSEFMQQALAWLKNQKVYK